MNFKGHRKTTSTRCRLGIPNKITFFFLPFFFLDKKDMESGAQTGAHLFARTHTLPPTQRPFFALSTHPSRRYCNGIGSYENHYYPPLPQTFLPLLHPSRRYCNGFSSYFMSMYYINIYSSSFTPGLSDEPEMANWMPILVQNNSKRLK